MLKNVLNQPAYVVANISLTYHEWCILWEERS